MEIFDDVFVDHEYEYIYKFIYYMYLLCSLQPLISTIICTFTGSIGMDVYNELCRFCL